MKAKYEDDEIKTLSRKISYIEGRRKVPPTKKDYIETKQYLKDFDIHVEVPQFEHLYELILWRKEMAKKRLDVLE